MFWWDFITLNTETSYSTLWGATISDATLLHALTLWIVLNLMPFSNTTFLVWSNQNSLVLIWCDNILNISPNIRLERGFLCTYGKTVTLNIWQNKTINIVKILQDVVIFFRRLIMETKYTESESHFFVKVMEKITVNYILHDITL